MRHYWRVGGNLVAPASGLWQQTEDERRQLAELLNKMISENATKIEQLTGGVPTDEAIEGAATLHVYEEEPRTTGNPLVRRLASAPLPGTCRAYVNGVRNYRRAAAGPTMGWYAVSGVTLTFERLPPSPEIRVDYEV